MDLTIDEKIIKLDNTYSKILEDIDRMIDIFSKRKIIYSRLRKIKNNLNMDYIDVKKRINLGEKNPNYLNFYNIYTRVIESEKDNIDVIFDDCIILDYGYNVRIIKVVGANDTRINNSFTDDFYENYSIIELIENFKKTYEMSISLPNKVKPEMIVVFSVLPSSEVCSEINRLGIYIKLMDDFPLPNPTENIIDTVNLDVSLLMTLCSEISNINISNLPEKHKKNLGLNVLIPDYLKHKNILYNEIMKYPKKIVCQTAWETFVAIVTKIGGKNENLRADELKKMLVIVKDNPTERISNIKFLKNKSCCIIFGTGESHNAITFSGNLTFIKFAEEKNIRIISKFFHPVPLTEKRIMLMDLEE